MKPSRDDVIRVVLTMLLVMAMGLWFKACQKTQFIETCQGRGGEIKRINGHLVCETYGQPTEELR